MTHSSTCTGCPQCNSVLKALVAAPLREQAIFNQRMTEAQNARLANRSLVTNCSAVPVARVRTLASDPNAPAYLAELLPRWDSFSAHAQNNLIAQIEADIRTAAAAPPEPVGIVNGLRAARGLAPIGMTPSFRDGQRPIVAAQAADGPPDPPSLIDAIQSSRRR